MADAVLIAALSGRALAAAARRAGYRPLVADLFGDLDTRRLAGRAVRMPGDLAGGLREEALLTALDRLAAPEGPRLKGLVYGAGFEDRPGLLARIAGRVPLLGNGPEQLSRLKRPETAFALLDRLGVPHPAVGFRPPAAPRGWLTKQAGASGGAHVRPARRGEAPAASRYFQRRVKGRPVSALFLADGERAITLGFSEQWPSPGGPRAPFRYGGAVQPAGLDAGLAAALGEIVRRVASEAALIGLNSADFLVRAADFDLLEINPRPGATLDIFDHGRAAALFDLHCRACAGQLPAAWTPPDRARAAAVVYARRRLTVAPGFRWPRWTADRPAPGTEIVRGAPVCTVFAQRARATDAREGVGHRSAAILAALDGSGGARAGRGARPPAAAEARP